MFIGDNDAGGAPPRPPTSVLAGHDGLAVVVEGDANAADCEDDARSALSTEIIA